MRGVSADGYAESVEELEAVTARADASQLAGELFAVADLLSNEPSLRRALTDPASDVAARSGLAHAVLDSKVSGESVDVLARAAAARWSSTSDFVLGVEQLAVLAVVIESDQQGQVGELEDELFRLERVVSANHGLRDALTNHQVPVEHRQELVRSLLEGKASPEATLLATQAIATRHSSFEVALEEYQRVAADRQQRLVAVVRTAVALTEAQHERLGAALARQCGREVHLNVVIDPDVLGGIRVELGDDVIEGTIAARLDDARRRIAK